MISRLTLLPTTSSQSFVRVAGALVVSIGCLVLIGWVLDITVLKSVLPSLVFICFLLLNSGILFVNPQ